MNNESFGQFLHFLESSVVEKGAVCGSTLIVKEPWSATTSHAVFRQIEDALPVRKIRFTAGACFDELTLTLAATLVQSISVFLVIDGELTAEICDLLTCMHTRRQVPIKDGRGPTVHNLSVPPTARLLMFVERSTVEAMRAIHDLSLFGSIISV